MEEISPQAKRAGTLKTAAALFFISVFLFSCGYRFTGLKHAGMGSVKIGEIKNTAREPGLSDGLATALAEELTKRGIEISSGSGYEISGSVNGFEMKGISEKGGFFSEYEISISGEFRLRTPDGKTEKLLGEMPFVVHYGAKGGLKEVMAEKEEAVRRALEGLASEIAASIIYGHEPK